MKELYTSPDAQVVCFAPVENLANNVIQFKDLYDKVENSFGGGKPAGSGGYSLPM